MNNTFPAEDEQNNIDTMYTSASYAVNYNRYGYVFGHCYVAAYSLSVDVAELIDELDAGDLDASQAADNLAEKEKQEILLIAVGSSPAEAMQNLHSKVMKWWDAEQVNPLGDAVKRTKLANELESYNKWRRGAEDIEQPSPTELGILIDEVIKELRK